MEVTIHIKDNVDGDALNANFIKEMKAVEVLMNMHPSTAMLGEDTEVIGNAVNITAESSIAMHSWLYNEDQFA